MEETSTATSIARILMKASRSYYDKGNSTLSDEQFDNYKERLRALEPEHPFLKCVGIEPSTESPLAKVRHEMFMGSLDNAFDETEFERFVRRVKGELVFLVQPKLDGLSVELVYENGIFVRAVTRGDGRVGEDVTHNMLKARGFPRTLVTEENVSVRGEVVILRKTFNKRFAEKANARNAAAGVLRRLDGKGARYLRFIGFDVVGPDFAFEREKIEWLSENTFAKVSSGILDDKETIEMWRTMREGRLNKFPYDIDGLVVKLDDIYESEQIGWTETTPKAHIAFKWRGSMLAETTVKGVEHSVGHTGAITPVAIVAPVQCGGVEIRRISLKNWNEVTKLGIGLGDKIKIERAGEVIPEVCGVIESAGNGTLPRPAVCPCCHTPTKNDGPRQLCPNPDCPRQTFRKIKNWIARREIMYLGDETLDRLMAVDGPVKHIDDLYTVRLDALKLACGGFIQAKKIRSQIEKSKSTPVKALIGAIGINGVGMRDAQKVTDELLITGVDDLFAIRARDLEQIEGIGSVKAKQIARGLRKHRKLILRLIKQLDVEWDDENATQQTVAGKLSGINVCVTGATDLPRKRLIELIEESGGTFKSSVSNKVHYLVMAAANMNTNKAKKARELGTEVITETQLLDMIDWDGEI